MVVCGQGWDCVLCGLNFLPMPKEGGLGYQLARMGDGRERGGEGLEAIDSQMSKVKSGASLVAQ